MKRIRVRMDPKGTIARENPEISKQDLLISLGKMSAVRIDTLCYIKSGAMKGAKAGTVTVACQEQLEIAETLLASVIGDDAGVLEPGNYSKE